MRRVPSFSILLSLLFASPLIKIVLGAFVMNMTAHQYLYARVHDLGILDALAFFAPLPLVGIALLAGKRNLQFGAFALLVYEIGNNVVNIIEFPKQHNVYIVLGLFAYYMICVWLTTQLAVERKTFRFRSGEGEAVSEGNVVKINADPQPARVAKITKSA